MKVLSENDLKIIDGGFAPLAVLGGVVLVGHAIDILYNASKAFADGYNDNDTY